MIGNEIAATEMTSRGVSEGAHGIDGAIVDAVVPHHAEQVLGVMLLIAVVLWLTTVDLGHGLDRITRVGHGDVGMLALVVLTAANPLRESLLVQTGPDVGTVRSTCVDGLTVGVGDGDLVVDLHSLGAIVVVASLVMEAHTEEVLAATAVAVVIHALVVRMHTGSAVDGRWVRPEAGEHGRNEPAVGGGALLRIIEVVLGNPTAVADAEVGHVVDHATVDGLKKVVVHITPRSIWG